MASRAALASALSSQGQFGIFEESSVSGYAPCTVHVHRGVPRSSWTWSVSIRPSLVWGGRHVGFRHSARQPEEQSFPSSAHPKGAGPLLAPFACRFAPQRCLPPGSKESEVARECAACWMDVFATSSCKKSNCGPRQAEETFFDSFCSNEDVLQCVEPCLSKRSARHPTFCKRVSKYEDSQLALAVRGQQACFPSGIASSGQA